MKTLRWILVIPAAMASALVVHFVAVFAQGLGMGLPKALAFWQATDMNGAWIEGTIAILWVRGTTGAASTWAAQQVAPRRKATAARIWLGVLVLVALIAAVYTVAIDSKVGTFSTWYRFVLETVAIVGGSFFTLPDANEDTGTL